MSFAIEKGEVQVILGITLADRKLVRRVGMVREVKRHTAGGIFAVEFAVELEHCRVEYYYLETLVSISGPGSGWVEVDGIRGPASREDREIVAAFMDAQSGRKTPDDLKIMRIARHLYGCKCSPMCEADSTKSSCQRIFLIRDILMEFGRRADEFPPRWMLDAVRDYLTA